MYIGADPDKKKKGKAQDDYVMSFMLAVMASMDENMPFVKEVPNLSIYGKERNPLLWNRNRR